MSDNRMPIWLGDTYEYIGLRNKRHPRDDVPTDDVLLLTVIGISVSGELQLHVEREGFQPNFSSVNLLTAKELVNDGIWKQVFNKE